MPAFAASLRYSKSTVRLFATKEMICVMEGIEDDGNGVRCEGAEYAANKIERFDHGAYMFDRVR